MFFGEIAVRDGYCTQEDVDEALRRKKAGDTRLIGEILIANNKLAMSQVEEILKTQRADIRMSS